MYTCTRSGIKQPDVIGYLVQIESSVCRSVHESGEICHELHYPWKVAALPELVSCEFVYFVHNVILVIWSCIDACSHSGAPYVQLKYRVHGPLYLLIVLVQCVRPRRELQSKGYGGCILKMGSARLHNILELLCLLPER